MHQFYSDIFQRVSEVWRRGRGEGGEGGRGEGKEEGGEKGGRGREKRKEEGEGRRGEGEEKDGLFTFLLSTLQIQDGDPWQEPSYLNAVLQEVLQSQYPSLEKR